MSVHEELAALQKRIAFLDQRIAEDKEIQAAYEFYHARNMAIRHLSREQILKAWRAEQDGIN